MRLLNTNNPNLTNIFWHTDLTDHTDFCSQRGAHMMNSKHPTPMTIQLHPRCLLGIQSNLRS